MFGLDAKDLIPIVISILALTLTLFQYFGEYDRNRKQATLEAYDQLQGEVFLTLNKLRKQYPILSPDRNFEERPTITNCLAKLERFCVGINLRIYDLRTLERCGGAYFVRQYSCYPWCRRRGISEDTRCPQIKGAADGCSRGK